MSELDDAAIDQNFLRRRRIKRVTGTSARLSSILDPDRLIETYEWCAEFSLEFVLAYKDHIFQAFGDISM